MSKRTPQNTLPLGKIGLALLGLALVFWPLYLVLLANSPPTEGAVAPRPSLTPEVTLAPAQATVVAEQPTLPPETPVATPPTGIPDIPSAYCIPAGARIERAKLSEAANANALVFNFEGEARLVWMLGTASLDETDEPKAYQAVTAWLAGLAGEELTVVWVDDPTLAYIFDGENFLNLDLIAQGLTAADGGSGHACAGLFAAAERGAYLAKSGLWAVEPFPQRNYTPLAPFFTVEVQYWADEIIAWSQQFGLDANLVATIIQIESCGNPLAVSEVGAMGLFQVMPIHFEEGEDPFDLNTNAKRGLFLLQDDLIRFENITQALAAYNTGYYRASQPPSSWPKQTKDYVYWGGGIYGDALSGAPTSATLQEWLISGGMTGCEQAADVLNIAGTSGH